MMATTHVLVGVALAAGTAVFAPEFAVAALLGGAVGGVFPDLDLYAGHRKTLHFPVYYSLLAFGALAIAAIAPSMLTVGVALFLLAAAVHSRMDAFGGGLELKPWLGRSDRAVYDHHHEQWIEPRRWIRYDGAPEDLVLAGFMAVPGLVIFDGLVQQAVVGVLVVSTGYAMVRKPMVYLTEYLVEALPLSILSYVPDRFIEDFESA